MPQTQRLLLIALAGAAGTLTRYWLALAVQRATGSAFPWGTFIVNMLGSFAFGLVWSLAEERMVIDAETRGIILTGFMGAFTTFSTFMFDSGRLFSDGNWPLALANLAGQIVIGLLCLFAGLAVGRML
jgi:fluoride exporter